METVFVAMSGGFDSSFAAYLLKQRGYKVIGVTFQLLPESTTNTKNPKACCSIETISRASRIAAHLSIPHYVFNLQEEFKEYVIERFIAEYRAGNTPNPCVLCNRFIKFSSFAKKAFSMGADKIATGHYAIIDWENDHYCLKKSNDRAKDQSYFLYPIEKEVLKKTLFPLGKHTKNQLREDAKNLAWNIHNLKESQDICFIPDNDYRTFLSQYITLKKGPVYYIDGTFLGYHQGIHLYTIGQRRGINIPYSKPLYVVDILPDDNTLIVGSKEDTGEKTLDATEINLLCDASRDISGKVRYRQKEEPCSYEVKEDTLHVNFSHPIDSVTPGQSVVLYYGDIVVGGGTIKKRINR
jgi:tRNA-specific 2-thiouridylase